MSQQFVKGYTNNHLTWVMVDATDFATPESALSAATKIKIYGKVKGATGANFVSSGTGSLTNDIQHVGASALGIYTIALAKADLSDASAAWYDQYIISLSATGAAYQTLIVDGGIWISDLSAIASDIRSDVSDMHSDLIVMSGILSDAMSMLTASSDAISNAYSAAVQTNSRVLLVQSRLSDLDSRLVSDVSDILSAVRGNSDALSDLLSRVNSASFLSDIASHVWAAKYTANSAASSFGSLMSDIYSRAGGAVTASDISDIASAVWATAIGTKVVSITASDMSDLRSAIAAGPAATITASDISDIASAVWARKYQVIGESPSTMASILLKGISGVSDIRSSLDPQLAYLSSVSSNVYALLSDFQSDFQSRVPKRVATDSQLSALHSDLDSTIVSSTSDIKSALTVVQSMASDTHSRATDIYVLLSDVASDVGVMSGVISDIASAVVNAVGVKKNTALNNFEFLLVDSGDHVTPKTGVTVTANRSIDGGAFAACANAVSEVSNGIYKISFATTDLNGDVITFRFSGTGADDRFVTIKTQP